MHLQFVVTFNRMCNSHKIRMHPTLFHVGAPLLAATQHV